MLRKTRFAPSPTGLIHIGNARTALFSALFGQQFLLRIEDTDQERSRSEFVAELIRDLQWLGIYWHEGPSAPEPSQEWFQSQRNGIYARYYHELNERNLAYPCFCSAAELEISRKLQASQGLPPRYSGKCANLNQVEIERKFAEGLQPTLRFRVPRGEIVVFADLIKGEQRFASDDIGDFIIRRADGTAAFFFSNAIDDALMGVTHVLRGDDHLANTPRQLLILQALQMAAPHYGHTALILGDDGAPLSKRNGSRSVAQMRDEGYLPIAVINMLARLGHHYEREELLAWPDLALEFSLNRVGQSPSRFDSTHLNYWQEQAIRAADDDELWAWLYEETRLLIPLERRHGFLEIVRSNCRFPAEAEHWAKTLFTDEFELDEPMQAVVMQAGEGFFLHAIDAATDAQGDYAAFLDSLKRRTGAKGKNLFMPLRVALTSQAHGPELDKVFAILEPHRLHHRLAQWSYSSG